MGRHSPALDLVDPDQQIPDVNPADQGRGLLDGVHRGLVPSQVVEHDAQLARGGRRRCTRCASCPARPSEAAVASGKYPRTTPRCRTAAAPSCRRWIPRTGFRCFDFVICGACGAVPTAQYWRRPCCRCPLPRSANLRRWGLR